MQVEGIAVLASPIRACQALEQPVQGRVVVVERGDCMFVDKARILQAAGAIAGIVIGESCTPHLQYSGTQPSLQIDES